MTGTEQVLFGLTRTRADCLFMRQVTMLIRTGIKPTLKLSRLLAKFHHQVTGLNAPPLDGSLWFNRLMGNLFVYDEVSSSGWYETAPAYTIFRNLVLSEWFKALHSSTARLNEFLYWNGSDWESLGYSAASGDASLALAVEALASGNAALTDAETELASGNAGIVLGLEALASGANAISETEVIKLITGLHS